MLTVISQVLPMEQGSTLVEPPAKEDLEREDDGDGEDEPDQDSDQHACPGTGNHLEK